MRFTPISLSLLLLAALSACTAPAPAPVPKSIAVAPEIGMHTIMFQHARARLSAEEHASLEEFMNSVPASAVSNADLAIDTVSKLGRDRTKRIGKYLMLHGLESKVIHVHSTPELRDTAVLTLHYHVAGMSAPCPDWSKNSVTNYQNTKFSNFGCAYYSDIAAQLADPEDYVHGHGRPTMDAARESGAIQRYMTGSVQASSASSASGGAGGSASSSGAASGAQ